MELIRLEEAVLVETEVQKIEEDGAVGLVVGLRAFFFFSR